ncbi:hypothetical protein KO116_03251 [Halomonas sp. KO116]|nr:hypothetical protein KO116_03251 [Halomonas sp. KO116]
MTVLHEAIQEVAVQFGKGPSHITTNLALMCSAMAPHYFQWNEIELGLVELVTKRIAHVDA